MMGFQKCLKRSLKFTMSQLYSLLKHIFLFVKVCNLNILNRFKFEIAEKPLNKLRFVMGIFIISAITLGYFGIRPEFIKLFKTLNLKNDLVHKKIILEEKQKNLVNYEKINGRLSEFVNRLNLAMPESPDMENYLISINQAANLNEMYINSFSASFLGKNAVVIDATLLGKTNKIGNLIKSIESLKRITKIKSVEVYSAGVEPYIKIKSEIYYLNPESSKEIVDIYKPISGKIDVEFLQGL